MSIVKFDRWENSNGSPKNAVLQVVQKVKKDTWSSGGNPETFYPVTGLDASIKLQSPTNKVLVIVNVHAGSGYWEIEGRITRNGYVIDAATGIRRGARKPATFLDNIYEGVGSQRYSWRPIHCHFLDSPQTTDPLTYGVELNAYSTFTVGVNFNPFFDNNSTDYYGQPISTVTLMEIAA